MSNGAGPYISVLDPLGAAIERVKVVLFQPFNLERWFIIGFCAWLASLMEAGGGGGGSGPNINLDRGSVEQFQREVVQNLPVIIAVGGTLLVVGIVVQIVCLWLSSRGKFMFLHCVATNRAEVRIPWRNYRLQGNSLFLFRLAVFFVGFFCFALLIGTAVALGVVLGQSGGPAPVIVVAACALPVFLLLVVVFALVGKFTEDFVTPVMMLRGSLCVPAWREFLGLLGANKGRFALYILFQIIFGMAVARILLLIAVATCCCAACIMAIPYIGTVFLLPLLVFWRAYSVIYLAQYGPPYDLIGALTPAPEPAPPMYMPPSGPSGSGPVQGL